MRVLVTGATGFIGQNVSRAFTAQGHEVVALGRRLSDTSSARRWALGDGLPNGVGSFDAVIHLASATITERKYLKRAYSLDIRGSYKLISEVRDKVDAGGCIKFVFISSQSAHKDASSAYGRSKWAIETMLTRPNEIIVRPGLVYSDEVASVYTALRKMSKVPLLPIIKGKPNIQPIHVDELADCVVQITKLKHPARLFQIGAKIPLTLQELIEAIARRDGRLPPLTIKLPEFAVRLAARIADCLLKSNLTERVDGLCNLRPMNTSATLDFLDRNLVPIDVKDAPIQRKSA